MALRVQKSDLVAPSSGTGDGINDLRAGGPLLPELRSNTGHGESEVMLARAPFAYESRHRRLGVGPLHELDPGARPHEGDLHLLGRDFLAVRERQAEGFVMPDPLFQVRDGETDVVEFHLADQHQ